MLEEISDQLEKTFMNEEISVKNGVGKKLDADDRIILNVGGVKVRFYVQKYENEMLHPINGNEFFFDRDGYLFRHILQYYRTGMIHWPETIAYHDDSTNHTSFESKKSKKSSEGSEIRDVNTIPSYIFPFSRSELEQEMQYFLIPAPPIFNLITPNLNVVKNETAPFRENIRKLLLPYAG
ncbi:8222_t:CDS:2, partial [Racocetra fulgida]